MEQLGREGYATFWSRRPLICFASPESLATVLRANSEAPIAAPPSATLARASPNSCTKDPTAITAAVAVIKVHAICLALITKLFCRFYYLWPAQCQINIIEYVVLNHYSKTSSSETCERSVFLNIISHHRKSHDLFCFVLRFWASLTIALGNLQWVKKCPTAPSLTPFALSSTWESTIFFSCLSE